MSESTIPCEICGTATTSQGTKRCNGCWEVEARLRDYLKHPAGQAHARSLMPVLDDWTDGRPDAWDYEAVLVANQVTVEWSDSAVDGDGVVTKLADEWRGWSMCWKHGSMDIGNTTKVIAKKAAALFVSLWLRGISASFADHLMDGFIVFLERQENPPSGATTMVLRRMICRPDRLHAAFGFAEEDGLLRKLGLQEGDQVGVVFHKIEEGN